MGNIILTGDRPTGKLHIGHYFGSLKTRIEMQNSGLYDPYILIADENEAIRSYDKAIEFVANADFDDIKKTAFLEKLNHIKNDEIDHVEKLMAMKGE